MLAAGDVSPRAWLLLCVSRERERPVWDLASVNLYAKPHSGMDRSFTGRQLSDALVELEDAGAIVREGTKWVLCSER